MPTFKNMKAARYRLYPASLLLLFAFVVHTASAQQPGLVKATFIYDEAPFPECHASTI